MEALSKVFRGKLTDGLIRLHDSGQIRLDTPFVPRKKYLHPLYRKKWVVYAKLPMHNAQQVVEYIGRYSHRIAISNHRIKAVDNDRVRFSAKDYRTSKVVELELEAVEFLRRFALHILPSGFMKIRHYGILSSRLKSAALKVARESLHAKEPEGVEAGNFSAYEWLEKLFGIDAGMCPQCKTGRMRLISVLYPPPRGSPQDGLSENTCFAA